MNVPTPESGHRWGDVVLHDGAPNGADLFDQAGYAAQDWTASIWLICRQCSEGRPPEDHEHPAPPFAAEHRFGGAAPLDPAIRLLGEWAAIQPGTRRHGDPAVVG